jgi:hypothetical protein
LTVVLLLAVALSLSFASVAFANGGDDRDDDQKNHFKAELNPLNRSGAEGHAILQKEGTKKLNTEIHSHGLAAKLPHAQHIHSFKQAVSECPTLAASGRDQLITTAEGLPSYGPIQVSLTTRGDTSPKSALAVDRFPVANAKGSVHYERTFSVPANVAQGLGKMAIVQHGGGPQRQRPLRLQGGRQERARSVTAPGSDPSCHLRRDQPGEVTPFYSAK